MPLEVHSLGNGFITQRMLDVRKEGMGGGGTLAVTILHCFNSFAPLYYVKLFDMN